MIDLEQQIVGIAQLALASMLGLLVGLTRERLHKSAGIRTHMLACMGTCLFTIISAIAFPGGDPARIAAGVVTGIGFLGAGVIFRDSNGVRDLTTAASIWTVAAIGMAVGAHLWLIATAATVMVWVILEVLRWYSKEMPHHGA